ncbi:leucine-rich_repeat domain-containing protein [Hexamita inflata]|uniref:Leucine-rich_repeat domain-containing protein n=1 Tax=Hexamita inflata TaxID=28002 RepID=A0ABP1GXA7_9EUKA
MTIKQQEVNEEQINHDIMMISKYKNNVDEDGCLKIVDDKFVNSIMFTEQLDVAELYIDVCYGLKFCRISTKLKKLEIHNCNIKNLDGIEKMKQLNILVLSAVNLRDISQLQYLDNLTLLNLQNCSICNITPIYNLQNLQTLNISENKLKSLHILSYLRKLKYLNLRDNMLTDIYPLIFLTNMEKLDLSQNQITNIYPIHSMKQLQTLILSRNNIVNIKSLFGLAQLQILSLSYNYIQKKNFKYIMQHPNFSKYYLDNQRDNEQFEKLSNQLGYIYQVYNKHNKYLFQYCIIQQSKTKFIENISEVLKTAANNFQEFSNNLVSLCEYPFFCEQ